ncbi:sensor histidine kinase [Lacisediminihabitans changchengi]|uniref:ATP-binding protein n=1 Tax=Lacisediminihabitans changchengi TaxID=2787634 RepID=A0A934SNX2_9MICO|nr:ATP-binding protein [Lacisediminihabitans changchengi]MBK4348774.1 ATP-binding protein [Lacisediminihabitans changchengi]
MSLGLPAHLIPRSEDSVTLRATHAVGITCLVSAVLVAVGYQSIEPGSALWPAMVAPIASIATLLYAARRATVGSSILALAVGALGLAVYIVTFAVAGVLGRDDFSLALPAIALLVVGGPGAGLLARVLWELLGYAISQLVVAAVAIGTDRDLRFDSATVVALAAILLIQLLNLALRSPFTTAQPRLHRATREEQVALLRYRMEVRAAALMHDTVLSHLAALAGSTDPVANPQLLTQIATDLAVLQGDEWLDDVTTDAGGPATAAWQQSPLFAAIAESRKQGLEVDATGDLDAVARLRRSSAQALALAVKQCLVNVLRHSGTRSAEVVVYALDDEVSVMVIDAGRGFVEAEAGSDRLGIRQSVRSRMEAVGGNVQVWSTPGRGTSIMIRVPVASESNGSAVGR